MRITLPSAALFLLSFGLPLSLFAQTSGVINRPPEAEPIHAELIAPTTHFTVTATDPDGDKLDYTWKGEISCGIFQGGKKANASWSHPNGDPPFGCPHDQGTSHPGTVYVAVSDGHSVVVCSYDGSESGTGNPCILSAVPPPWFGHSQWWWNDVINDYEDALDWLYSWLWYLLFAATIVLPLYLYKNGLFVNQQNDEDPCAELRRKEEDARARYNSAKAAFNDLDESKHASDDAEKKAKSAESAAQTAKDRAGGRWSADGSTDWQGEHTEVYKEGWQNKDLGKAADDADAAAKNARADANKTRSDFDAKGGDGAWSKAKSDMEKAKADWEKADAALHACMNTPKPTPKPEPKPEPPKTDGGNEGGKKDGPTTPMTTDGGPTPGTGTTPPKKEEPKHICYDGEKRNDTSESADVSILDLQSVVLKQDKIYSDAGNEAMKFVDYLQTAKDLFMLGGNVKGGVDTYLEHSVDGAAGAVGFPDFLTWYDKGVDELTKSMYRLYTIMQDKQALGDYWLEYRVKKLTITCHKWEECANNGWVRHSELTISDNGFETHRTDPVEVLDAHEVEHAISQLFTKLRNRYNGDKNRAKQLADRCSS